MPGERALAPGHGRHMEQRRQQACHRQQGFNSQGMVDVERAQVPAKALTLGKLSAWSINFFSNFAAKTTRIVLASSIGRIILRKPIPRVR